MRDTTPLQEFCLTKLHSLSFFPNSFAFFAARVNRKERNAGAKSRKAELLTMLFRRLRGNANDGI